MRNWMILVSFVPFSVFAACTAAKSSFDDDDGGGGSTSSNTGGAGQTATTTDAVTIGVGTGGSTGSGTPCNSGPDEDADGDGWTVNDGDCNDCDANANPGAIEVVGDTSDPMYEAVDEDCDGTADNPPLPCDGALAMDSSDPMDGARAMELCKVASGASDWGVVSAQWTLPAGNAHPNTTNFHLGHGILNGFGPNVNVQAGTQMLVLSSGTARRPGDPGYQSPGGFSKGISNTGHPFGFPKESPSCNSAVTGACNDGVALEVTLRAPTNATGFRFNFDFYTYEWPVYVCSTFNDFFAAILEPFPQGQTDGNITFDQLGNPVSVNNAFFAVCGCSGGPPCTAGGISFTCALGTAELQGTGFEGHAATSWLQTQAPVEGGTQFKLRFLAYDSGDGALDSTALVDNFQWLAEPGVAVGTEPIPDPK
jgi:hypothetical protein